MKGNCVLVKLVFSFIVCVSRCVVVCQWWPLHVWYASPRNIFVLTTFLDNIQMLFQRHLGMGVSAQAGQRGLLDTAGLMLSSALASSTQATYDAGVKCYRNFCVELELAPSFGVFVPPTEYVLVLFVVSLTKSDVQSVTQRGYIAAVNSFARLRGIDTCVMPNGQFPPLLSAMLTAARRVYAASPAALAARDTTRLPVTSSMMRLMLEHAHSALGQSDASRFCLVIILLFLNCLRCSEVMTPVVNDFDPAVHLNRGDVNLDHSTGRTVLLLEVKQSKTDQFRKGRQVVCSNQAGTLFAVVPALGAWLRARASILGGDVAGPFFVSSNGKPFSTVEFRLHLNKVCSAAGLPLSRVKPHSFRRGAATVLAAQGVEDSALQNFGFWRSNAFRLYVDETALARSNLQQILATSTL